MSVESNLGERLSAREHEVMRLLCSGLVQKQVAGKLNCDPKTVNTHILRAREKLGAKTTTQAAFFFACLPGEAEYRSWL